jgi:hypothetical protein
MRPTPDRRPGEGGQGGGLTVARWCASAGRDAVWGAQRARAADNWPHRGGGQGLWQAGGRGGDAAQTP